ncbi:MAG TPA: hypothetical protein VGD14_23060 [bacterium]
MKNNEPKYFSDVFIFSRPDYGTHGISNHIILSNELLSYHRMSLRDNLMGINC